MAMKSYQPSRSSFMTKEISFTSLAPASTATASATKLENQQTGGEKGEIPTAPQKQVPDKPTSIPTQRDTHIIVANKPAIGMGAILLGLGLAGLWWYNR